jgi:hypothetical protein
MSEGLARKETLAVPGAEPEEGLEEGRGGDTPILGGMRKVPRSLNLSLEDVDDCLGGFFESAAAFVGASRRARGRSTTTSSAGLAASTRKERAGRHVPCRICSTTRRGRGKRLASSSHASVPSLEHQRLRKRQIREAIGNDPTPQPHEMARASCVLSGVVERDMDSFALMMQEMEREKAEADLASPRSEITSVSTTSSSSSSSSAPPPACCVQAMPELLQRQMLLC